MDYFKKRDNAITRRRVNTIKFWLLTLAFLTVISLFGYGSLDLISTYAQEQTQAEEQTETEQQAEAQTQEQTQAEEQTQTEQQAEAQTQEQTQAEEQTEAQTQEQTQTQAQPIIVDGDVVEYATEGKDVTAQGNVVINYGDARMSCDKIVVNTQTKDVVATGNVRLEDPRGILEAEKLTYNFQTKMGDIPEARLRSAPYYYYGKKVMPMGKDLYIVKRGHFSSCNYDNPHYRVKSKRTKVIPDDRVIAYSNKLFWSKFPLFYFPVYSHSLKDPWVKVQFKFGKSSEWGPYVLSTWRTGLSDNVQLRMYLDYRDRYGHAQGFGVNYYTKKYGKGDFKFYYTNERRTRADEIYKQEFQRYMARLRHTWDIDPSTNLTVQYYRIQDNRTYVLGDNFLSDYFYEEHKYDSTPKSYVLLKHALAPANVSIIAQKRTNRWMGVTEKLPEIVYDLPKVKFGQSPFYLENKTSFSCLNLKNAHPSDVDRDVVRFHTDNRLTLPVKIMIFEVSPYVGLKETYYSKDIQGGAASPRTAFNTGVDTSTKFYRVFKAKGRPLGIEINNLRHIITPRILYSYNHKPTFPNSRLQQIDGTDSLSSNDNRFALELENRLQTKREGESYDLASFLITTDYTMYSKSGGITKGQDRFGNFVFSADLIPYAWLRMSGKASYDHLQDYFTEASIDSWFDFAPERTLGIGHRYARGGSREMTSQLEWRINPKWKFRFYGRYQLTGVGSCRHGLREQEYTISRDLHCATIEFSYSKRKAVEAKEDRSFWCEFHLKIFKESEYDYARTYRPPSVSH